MCDEKEDPRVARQSIEDRSAKPYTGGGIESGVLGYQDSDDSPRLKNPIPSRGSRTMGLLDRLESEVSKAVTAKEMEEKEIDQRTEFYMRLGYDELCNHIKKLNSLVKSQSFDLQCAHKALGKKLGL